MSTLPALCLLFLSLNITTDGIGQRAASRDHVILLSTPGIQRVNMPFVLSAEPSGIYNWQIFRSDNDSLVASFREASPSVTLTAGAYDVLVSDGKERTRHFRRRITVLPPVFSETEADEVIDFSPPKDTGSVVRDYENKVRPGYKILIKGSLKGRLKISGLRGTKDNPVHIMNDGAVVIQGSGNKAYPWTWDGNNQYILLDGCAAPGIRYGFTVIGNPVKGAQTFMIGGEFNKGFEIAGLQVLGQFGRAPGAAAIQVQTSYTPACNATNWNFEYFKVHHTRVERANTEGFYIGYATDAPRDNGLTAYPMGQVLLYRDTIVDSGWDALQIASADEFEIHDNFIKGSALANKKNQRSFFSWNDGTLKGYCYRNSFYDCKHGVAIGYGYRGREAFIYNNLFVEGKKTAPPDSARLPGFFYAKLHNQHQRVGLYIFNNTVITSLLPCKISYKNIYTTEGIPLVFAGNALVMGLKNPRKKPEISIEKPVSRDSASRIIDNRWAMRNQPEPLQLGTEDYRPASATSPLLQASFDVKARFPALKGGYYDRDGYPMQNDSKQFTFGCFSSRTFVETQPPPHGTDKRD